MSYLFGSTCQGFPPFLEVESVFRAIRNHLRKFLEANLSFLQTRDQGMAHILVSLNPRAGLEEEIQLQYKDYKYVQQLDYEHLPFQCHRCHIYGHLAKECPMGFKRWRKHRKVEVGVAEEEELKGRQTKKSMGEDQMDIDKQHEDTVEHMEL